MLLRVLRTSILLAFVIPAIPAYGPTDRSDHRQGSRHRRRCASGRHGRGACRRAAGASRHDDRRQRRVPAAGAAAWRLHADVRALRNADRHATGRGAAVTGHGGRRHARRAGRDRKRRGHRRRRASIEKESATHQERRLERADHGAAGRAGVSRSPQDDSRRAVQRRTSCADRAPAAADRTTSTTSTA